MALLELNAVLLSQGLLKVQGIIPARVFVNLRRRGSTDVCCLNVLGREVWEWVWSRRGGCSSPTPPL